MIVVYGDLAKGRKLWVISISGIISSLGNSIRITSETVRYTQFNVTRGLLRLEAARYIIHFELDCKNEPEMNEWYDTVVHERLTKLSGYRRSQHYRAGIMEDGSPGDKVARFICLHEFDYLQGLSPDIIGLDTELGKKVLGNASTFHTRSFGLLGADPAVFRPGGFENPAYNPIPSGH